MNKAGALIVTEDGQMLEQAKSLLAEQGLDVHTSSEWKPSFSAQEQYSYYLVDDAVLGDLDLVKVSASGVLIGLTQERSFERVREWMRRGAHDVIVIPDELDKLKTLPQHPVQRFKVDETAAAHEEVLVGAGGRVRAFYSAKGGSGKTLIAAMVAQNLQLQFGRRVILIDFNAQFGGLEVVLGLEPKRSYLDLQPVLHELSLNHIHNVAVQEETTGINVLLSPVNPEQAEQITDELVSRVIRTCKSHFDEVIIDVPSALSTISFTALNESQDIYYVITPDSLSVRGLKYAMSLFERFQLGNRGNLHLIMNRKNKKSELSEKDLLNLVDLPLAGSVRADYYAIQPFLNMGRPFYSKKGDKGSSKTAQDVRALVEKAIVKGV